MIANVKTWHANTILRVELNYNIHTFVCLFVCWSNQVVHCVCWADGRAVLHTNYNCESDIICKPQMNILQQSSVREGNVLKQVPIIWKFISITICLVTFVLWHRLLRTKWCVDSFDFFLWFQNRLNWKLMLVWTQRLFLGNNCSSRAMYVALQTVFHREKCRRG